LLYLEKIGQKENIMLKNNIGLRSFGILAVGLFLSTMSFATPLQFDLDLNYAHFFERGSAVSLKEVIHQAYPGTDLSGVDLQKVRVTAKSRYGHGKMVLEIGGQDVDSGSVSGTPDEFDDWHPISFDYAVLYNDNPNLEGDWILRFVPEPASNGIVVTWVQVFVDMPASAPCGWHDWWIDGSCVKLTAMYQFYSVGKREHFYSPGPASPGGDYVGQGLAWGLPQGSYRVNGIVPFYRLYNASVGDHFYTADQFESDRAVRRLQYQYEVTYQIFREQVSGTVPLFRFYNATTGDHFYKTDDAPVPGYVFELIAGYVIAAGALNGPN
jgi:hypothetical protein